MPFSWSFHWIAGYLVAVCCVACVCVCVCAAKCKPFQINWTTFFSMPQYSTVRNCNELLPLFWANVSHPLDILLHKSAIFAQTPQRTFQIFYFVSQIVSQRPMRNETNLLNVPEMNWIWNFGILEAWIINRNIEYPSYCACGKSIFIYSAYIRPHMLIAVKTFYMKSRTQHQVCAYNDLIMIW